MAEGLPSGPPGLEAFGQVPWRECLSLTALRRAGDVCCGEPYALPAGDFFFGRHELPTAVQQVGLSVSSRWFSSLFKRHQIQQ